MSGYDNTFLGVNHQVPLPVLNTAARERAISPNDVQNIQLDYPHYSVIMDPVRKFPLLTAANIDGGLFRSIQRTELFKGGSDRWKIDERIPDNAQWGMELYSADKSDFDRGHMTKREDVQWGENEEIAADAARNTFYFTNAIPQHARVNQSIWRRIEDYILKKESVKGMLKISVFTGPIMRDSDPEFVSEVNGQIIKIPTIFWKVIYYINEAKELSQVAFMVGQKYLLEKDGIVKRKFVKASKRERFMNFKYADTYQVDIGAVEALGALTFCKAHEPFQQEKPIKLILEQIEVKRGKKGEDVKEPRIRGLIL